MQNVLLLVFNIQKQLFFEFTKFVQTCVLFKAIPRWQLKTKITENISVCFSYSFARDLLRRIFVKARSAEWCAREQMCVSAFWQTRTEAVVIHLRYGEYATTYDDVELILLFVFSILYLYRL